MQQCIPLETLKAQAAVIARKGVLSQDQATLGLIHGHGYQNVDFSGGVRADPNEKTYRIPTAPAS